MTNTTERRGRIPNTFIQDLLARTNIVDIIQPRIELKKKGPRYSACCPFHDEKTPSFSVNPDKQFYYCFGCGATGNAIRFLMEYDRMEFVEAVEHLAAQQGMDVPRESSAQSDEPTEDFTPLYSVMEKALDYYRQQLPSAKLAVDYLKNRGLSGEIAKAFGLGFAPPGWRHLSDAFRNNETWLTQLVRVGVIVNSDKGTGYYDRFHDDAGRIMFPIRDVRGRVVGFGGRTLGDGVPKYINSPETPIYHKSQELYGLYEARSGNRKLGRLVVVEGYMDVIALHQHGIIEAVAALGTAINVRHVQKLLRYTNEVVFCLDGDTAGRRAAWRALTLSLPLLRDGVVLRFLFLPEGEDPDTLVRKLGQEEFSALLDQAPAAADVFFDCLPQQECDGQAMGTLEEKAQYASKAMHHLSTMPKGIFQRLMIEQLAQRLAVKVDDVEAMVARKLPQHSESEPEVEQVSPQNLSPLLEKAVVLLLHYPRFAGRMTDGATQLFKKSRAPGMAFWCELLEACQSQTGLTVGAMLEDPQLRRYESWIIGLSSRDSPLTAEEAAVEFDGAVMQLGRHYRDEVINTLVRRSRQGTLSDTEKDVLCQLLQQKVE